MTGTILRGRVLTFLDEPQSADDISSYRYFEDGAVFIADGKIVSVGDYHKANIAGATVIDHHPNLILPGLIDPHIHFPQMQVIGSYAGGLLEWLNTYTFVEEQRFADSVHSQRIASLFLDELIRHGTTTAAVYASVHRQSPELLRDTPQQGYDDTKALIAAWHGKGRAHYAITPRFAITSSPEQMEMAEALAREHPDCHIQTHLSENLAEVEFAKELYPNIGDYTGIYQRYHLLGPKTLLGHAIHLSHHEAQLLAETRSVAVFCPTSNLFLGSGLFDYERLHTHGVRIAVATDVGGGTSYSMLRTLDEGFKVLQLRGQHLTPLASFYLMTLGNARALSLEGTIGSLAPGADADIVVLDARATPQMALRMETVASLRDELFVLQTCGDDRSVAEVYVAGKAMKGHGGLELKKL